MKFVYSLILVLIICALSATLAAANQPMIYVENLTPQNTEEASIFVLPDGSGPSLAEAMLFGGQIADASVTLNLITDYGGEVANYPLEDIWLQSDSRSEVACTISFLADGDTDASGATAFASSLVGGGSTEGPIWVIYNGSKAMYDLYQYHPPLQLRINSADINGDLTVNLSDVTLFTTDFYGSYNYRSDFHWDGVLDLSDVVKMATGLGRSCQ